MQGAVSAIRSSPFWQHFDASILPNGVLGFAKDGANWRESSGTDRWVETFFDSEEAISHFVSYSVIQFLLLLADDLKVWIVIASSRL